MFQIIFILTLSFPQQLLLTASSQISTYLWKKRFDLVFTLQLDEYIKSTSWFAAEGAVKERRTNRASVIREGAGVGGGGVRR